MTNTAKLYATYLAECKHGQKSSLPPHTATHNEAKSPVVIVWRRGDKISVCIGTSTQRNVSPDVGFHVDLTRVVCYQSVTAAFDFLHAKFINKAWIKRMIDSKAFRVWPLEKLTAVSQGGQSLGDSFAGQPPAVGAY